MNLTPTEIEDLRIAIAEECIGKEQLCDCKYPEKDMCVCMVCGGRLLPNYTASIDSIRKAAMDRFKTHNDKEWFEIYIGYARMDSEQASHAWQLTALDWAIAFARTAKIWRYKV